MSETFDMYPKYYSYFFTRQDISFEQQLVQTAHAALKLGVNSQKEWDSDIIEETSKVLYEDKTKIPKKVYVKDIDPDHTYFTCVGVRNLEALIAVYDILTKFDYKFEFFVEPDIGNEMTAIAVYPVREDDRGPLLAFNLLKMGSRG